MNAGSALGLLAGLGAINALRGGKDGKRFTSLIDMIDGGGAGQSGDKFEGGGLLSMLGNLFAKPYEAQDNVERIAKEAAVNKVVNQPKPNVNQTFIPSSGTVTKSTSEKVRPSVNRNYRIKGTYDPVGVTTVDDALDSLFHGRMPEGAHNPAYSIEKALIQRDIFNPKSPQYWDEQNQDLRYLMPPNIALNKQADAEAGVGMDAFGGYLTPAEERAQNQALSDAANLTYGNGSLRSSFRKVTQPSLTETDQSNLGSMLDTQPETPINILPQPSGSSLLPPEIFSAPMPDSSGLSDNERQLSMFNSLMSTVPRGQVNDAMVEAYREYLLGGDVGVETNMFGKMSFPEFFQKNYMSNPEVNQAPSIGTVVNDPMPRFGPEGFGYVEPMSNNGAAPSYSGSTSILPSQDVSSGYVMPFESWLKTKGNPPVNRLTIGALQAQYQKEVMR